MRTELFWLLSSCGFAAVSLLCGLLVWPQLVAVWPSIEEKIDRFRRLPPLAKLVVLLFVGAFVVYGSTKTNLVDQGSGMNSVMGASSFGGRISVKCAGEEVDGGASGNAFRGNASTDAPQTITPEDIARGWRLWEVKTNCNVSYAMPEGATLATNWWVRGAYEDVKRIGLGGLEGLGGLGGLEWRFPFGTNEHDSAWAFSWGKLRFALGDAETEIVAVGAPMSAVPYRSRLWSGVGANGARVVTWENFALGRWRNEDVRLQQATGTPLLPCANAQIELWTTGDFVTRSNEVETVYHRIDDFDWDGDGIINIDDWDPYCYDGNCTGQEPWWRGYVDEMVGVGQTNGYYKLTATVSDRDFQRRVITVGDERVVVAEPGEYVFLLEKGLDYEIDVYPFSPYVTFEAVDDLPLVPRMFGLLGGWWHWTAWSIDEGRLVLRYPTLGSVGYCCWMPTFHGSPNVQHIGPDDDHAFEAVLDDYAYPDWASYEWSSDDGNIVIGSPSSRETHVWFYEMPSWREASLKVTATIGTNTFESVAHFTYGIHPEPQVHPVLISPNVVVKDGKRRKLQVEFSSDRVNDGGTLQLRCTQGCDKIALWSEESGGTPVDFEKSWSCSSFGGFECYIAGTNTSESVDDVVFSLAYIPESGGDSKTESGSVTVVDYVSEPISSIECSALPGRPYMNPCAIQRGRPEAFGAILLPLDAPVEWLSWRAKEGQASFQNENVGRMVIVDAVSPTLLLEALIYGYDDEPDPIEFKVDVVQGEE